MTQDWLRERAPLLDAFATYTETARTPFIIPGHHGAAGRLSASLGHALQSDIPFWGALDGVRVHTGVLDRAEAAGAQAWDADWCRYSTGGSTHANQVLALAIGRPGDKVLVARNSHRSVLLGIVLAGLRPVWLPADVDPRAGLPTGLCLPAVEAALAEHPDAVAIWSVDPGYVGTIGDLSAVIEVGRRHDVPVLVDQAWGAHLGFHPDYPSHAMALGADAMVTSAHKTLVGFSQAALVVARTQRLDRGRLERAFEACATTSPSGAMLASLDATRALLTSDVGRDLLGVLLQRVARTRSELAELGIATLDPAAFGPGRFDPAKLVISLASSGHDGLTLERNLLAEGVNLEMADRDLLVPIVSMLDDDAALAAFVTAVRAAAPSAAGEPRSVVAAPQWEHVAPQILTPREAFFAKHEVVAADRAVGRISAELIAPYPPGIPVVMPGEEITEESVAALHAARDSGARIAYAADPTLETFHITAE